MRDTALIIEDDVDMGTIFAAAMHNAGFATDIIEDGQAALTRLATVVPDVVVLDLHLPNVSGSEILDYILSQERLAQTRVIIATADPLLADTLRDKVTFVLDKPVSFKQLTILSTRLKPNS